MNKQQNPNPTNTNQSENLNSPPQDSKKPYTDQEKWQNYCQTLENLIN